VKYLIVIEKSKTGYSAYSPDVPGCVATGSTKSRAEKAMREAIEFHLEGLRADGQKVPSPRSSSAYVEVPA
jgi:predicted RNase H-like HicB family nuclease